ALERALDREWLGEGDLLAARHDARAVARPEGEGRLGGAPRGLDGAPRATCIRGEMEAVPGALLHHLDDDAGDLTRDAGRQARRGHGCVAMLGEELLVRA